MLPRLLTVTAVLILSVSAAAAQQQQVAPEVVAQVRAEADAAYKARKPAPPKTPEQLAAQKQQTVSSCEAYAARLKERGINLTASCQ